MANEVLLNISQDPNERARFRSRRIWLQDREHEQAVWKEEGRLEGRQEVGAEYESLLENKDAEIASKDAEIANKDSEIANKDAEIANKDSEIRALLAQLETLQKVEL